MEGNKRIAYLLDCYVKNTCTPKEKEELTTLLNTGMYDEQVKHYMDRAWDTLPHNKEIPEAKSQQILSSILAKNEGVVISMQPSKGRRVIIWAAASVLLIIATTATFFYLNNRSASATVVNKQAKKTIPTTYDVAPGINGAVLTLADGSEIVLDNAADGTLAQQGGASVLKSGGTLNYVDGENGAASGGASYNTITTPRGRQFQLVLEDGTKVWLNAGSSLKFPTVFYGKTREVAVTGEAYFEVAKNAAKPFRVEAKGMKVEVLGTHFNVNAYDDETSLNTTLLEGSVKISKGDNSKLLVPGDQARLNELGQFKLVKNINTDEVVAWKNNSFSFNNTNMNNLLRQLSRWYDVEVEIKGANQQVTFNGSISRAVNLSTVLKMLESTGEVKFSIEGKKIFVSM